MPTPSKVRSSDKAPKTKDYEEEPGLGRANVDRDEQGGDINTEDPVEVRPGHKKDAVPSKRRSTPSTPSR